MIAWLAQETTTTTSSGTSGAVIGVLVVSAIALYLLFAFALLGVFRKAGKPAWGAFVPIANEWFLFEAAGRPGWWVLLGFIPICGGLILLVMWIIVCIDLANSFGKGGGFAVGLIFLSLIFLYILVYGSAQYRGPAARGVSGGYGGAMPPPPPPPSDQPGWAPPQ
jgi:hypothetical protein